MARKQKHEEHENHERWLISYADFITLLFAFFVVMYSLSSVNEGKFRVLAESLAASFRGPPKSLQPIELGSPMISGMHGTPNPQSLVENPALTNLGKLANGFPIKAITTDMESLMTDSEQEGEASEPSYDGYETLGEPGKTGKAQGIIDEIAKSITSAMLPLIDSGLITVRKFRFWLEIEIKTSILFESGQAKLEGNAVTILENIAAILARYPNPVRIEGFTDNVPIQTWQYPSNWELSAARAISVVHLFAARDIDPDRLAAIGHGEYKPEVPNDTEENRQKNRRITIIVLADKNKDYLPDLNPGAELPATADGVEPGAADLQVEESEVEPVLTQPENNATGPQDPAAQLLSVDAALTGPLTDAGPGPAILVEPAMTDVPEPVELTVP